MRREKNRPSISDERKRERRREMMPRRDFIFTRFVDVGTDYVSARILFENP